MTFPSLYSILSGIVLGSLTAFLAYKMRTLNRSGAFTAALLGALVFGLGGWSYTAVLLAFFLSSSGFSFAFKRLKKNLSQNYAKGDRRDGGQVTANGGVAGGLVILHTFLPQIGWIWWAYCASLAAAAADTWATELGVLSPTAPRLITNGKPVEMGTSGGVTTTGTLAALCGAFFVSLFGFAFAPQSPALALLVTFAGFSGALVDSILGATVQAIYYCPHCQKETEKYPVHTCGTATSLLRGYRWINNDLVNTCCTLSAAGLIFLIEILTGIF